MSTWQDRLLEADEAMSHDLSAEDVLRLRKTVIAAVGADSEVRRWPLSFTILAGSLTAASVALVLSTAMGAMPAPAESPRATAAERATSAQAPADGERRQLQFATPGGTRIIWVFDTDFEVKGTLP